MLPIIAAFVSGLLLFNAVPHMVRGICGKSHMTPFARRSGPVVNVIWAWINILVGLVILQAAVFPCSRWCAGAFFLGGIVISVYLSAFWSNPEARLPWHRD